MVCLVLIAIYLAAAFDPAVNVLQTLRERLMARILRSRGGLSSADSFAFCPEHNGGRKLANDIHSTSDAGPLPHVIARHKKFFGNADPQS